MRGPCNDIIRMHSRPEFIITITIPLQDRLFSCMLERAPVLVAVLQVQKQIWCLSCGDAGDSRRDAAALAALSSAAAWMSRPCACPSFATAACKKATAQAMSPCICFVTQSDACHPAYTDFHARTFWQTQVLLPQICLHQIAFEMNTHKQGMTDVDSCNFVRQPHMVVT